jgi:hypothetical protein
MTDEDGIAHALRQGGVIDITTRGDAPAARVASRSRSSRSTTASTSLGYRGAATGWPTFGPTRT